MANIENCLRDLIQEELDNKDFVDKYDVEDLIADSVDEIKNNIHSISNAKIEISENKLNSVLADAERFGRNEYLKLIKDLKVVRGLRWYEVVGILALVQGFMFVLNLWIF